MPDTVEEETGEEEINWAAQITENHQTRAPSLRTSLFEAPSTNNYCQ